MRGHLRKRGNAWELRAYAGIDPLTNRQKYVTRAFRGGKREAASTYSTSVSRSLADRIPQSEGQPSVKTGRSSTTGTGASRSARSKSQSWVTTTHTPWSVEARSGLPESPSTIASSGRSTSMIDP